METGHLDNFFMDMGDDFNEYIYDFDPGTPNPIEYGENEEVFSFEELPKIDICMKQTTSSKFIDLENLDNTFLKDPYTYTVIVSGVDPTLPVGVELFFEDGNKSINNGVKIVSAAITVDGNIQIKIKFLITSYKNQDRKFKIVVFSAFKEIWRSKCGFYLRARPKPNIVKDRSRKITTKSRNDYRIKKPKKMKSPMIIEEKRKIMSLYDNATSEYRGFLNVDEVDLDRCLKFFASLNLNATVDY